jgi:hypothetical protein
MKNLFSAVLLTSLVGATTTAQAQSTIEFGPRLGLNISTVQESGTPDPSSGFNDEIKSIAGVQIGATLNVGINDNLSFQPSLIYSRKGAEFTGTADVPFNPAYKTTIEATATPKIGYLELPLNFVYTFGGHDGFQVFAGPYVAMGVSSEGSAKGKINTNDPDVLFALGGMTTFPASLKVKFGDQQVEEDPNANPNNTNIAATVVVRRFDAGLNAGVGYRVGPFQAQLGYGLGLVNFVPKDTDGNDTGSKAYNRVFQLSANYFFGGK